METELQRPKSWDSPHDKEPSPRGGFRDPGQDPAPLRDTLLARQARADVTPALLSAGAALCVLALLLEKTGLENSPRNHRLRVTVGGPVASLKELLKLWMSGQPRFLSLGLGGAKAPVFLRGSPGSSKVQSGSGTTDSGGEGSPTALTLAPLSSPHLSPLLKSSKNQR